MSCKLIERALFSIAGLAAGIVLFSQPPSQTIKGIVIDKDSRAALPGANIVVINSSPLTGASADQNGKFSLNTGVGRVSLKATFLGYEDLIVKDILVATGKEIDLTLEMTEKVIRTGEVIVTASGSGQVAINPMAAVSTNTVRSDDALRYAGGFYDPSRIVNSFAGVVTANNDESNDIVIRGNSSRGLLWRLEGIEIPNPNHFSDGQGGSGGAYSAITSNVISNFDFFTGAFPAEYGNAISGVMDLNLRKGNSDKYEFAFQTGMIGAEISAEGPLEKNKGSSFLFNGRYVSFKILSDLNLIDLGETNYAPRSEDVVINLSLPAGKAGIFNVFGFYGKSEIGKTAVHDLTAWHSDADRWEEFESLETSVIGLKHLFTLPRGNSYIRSVIAYTGYRDSYSEGFVDSSFVRTNSYFNEYRYPSIRYSVMMNSKLTPKIIIRAGASFDFLGAEMKDLRMNQQGNYDTLVSPHGSGILTQAYIQMKNRISNSLEFNSGIHMTAFSVNKDICIEPRFGMRWKFARNTYFTAGAGFHSRIEAFPVYYNLIVTSPGIRSTVNKDLELSQSFHLVAGLDLSAGQNLRIRIEGYDQQLFNIPIIDNPNSRYSAINSAEDLPSSPLANEGLGYNRGIELTIEKSYSLNFYFLATLSLFTSKYRAGDDLWYNTYYNNTFVSNLLAGKDFYFGKENRSCFGINSKMLLRGGYRYTPVDLAKSLKNHRIIYDQSRTYEEQMPDFFRMDGGISYRRNNKGFSWILMLDVQNITNRKNVFRKRFTYLNNSVVETNVNSLGAVPVMNFRIEF